MYFIPITTYLPTEIWPQKAYLDFSALKVYTDFLWCFVLIYSELGLNLPSVEWHQFVKTGICTAAN